MMRRLIGSILAGIMLCATLGPSLAAADTQRQITVELTGPTGPQESRVTLSEATVQEIREIIDDVNRDAGTAATTAEHYQAYTSAVARLYLYGVFGGLSLAQAQRLVTRWYREEPSGQRNPQAAGLVDLNLFCLVAGHTTLTYTGRPLPFIIIMTGIAIFLISVLLTAHPYPGIIGSILMAIGGAIEGFGEALVYRVDINPVAVADFFSVGVYNWFRTDYVYATGWATTLGLLGPRIRNGELRGSLPGKIRFDETYFACPALYEFSGIKIWMSEDGGEKLYLGSAIAAGFTVNTTAS